MLFYEFRCLELRIGFRTFETYQQRNQGESANNECKYTEVRLQRRFMRQACTRLNGGDERSLDRMKLDFVPPPSGLGPFERQPVATCHSHPPQQLFAVGRLQPPTHATSTSFITATSCRILSSLSSRAARPRQCGGKFSRPSE